MTYSISRLDTANREEWLRRMRYDVEIEGTVVLLDHTPRRPNEICQHQIEIALELGYRGRDSQDLRDIRRVMTVATGEANIDFLYQGAKETDLSIQLDEMAEDAREYIGNALGEGYVVYDDGEAGATLVDRVGTGADGPPTPYPSHDDECILNCPVGHEEKCRIGHGCRKCAKYESDYPAPGDMPHGFDVYHPKYREPRNG